PASWARGRQRGALLATVAAGVTLAVPPLEALPEDVWSWSAGCAHRDAPAGATVTVTEAFDAYTTTGWPLAIYASEAATPRGVEHRLHVVFRTLELGTIAVARGAVPLAPHRAAILAALVTARPTAPRDAILSLHDLLDPGDATPPAVVDHPDTPAADAATALQAAIGFLARGLPTFLRPVPDVVALVKRAAEVATLVDLAASAGLGRRAPALAPVLDAMLDRAWHALRRGDLLRELVDHDARLVALAPAYVHFHRRGLRHPRLAARLADHETSTAATWLPRLATAMALRAIGVPSRHLDADALAAASWIATARDLDDLTVARAYETTHVVLWLSLLGPTPAAIGDRVRATAPRWIDRFLARRDADVAAELAMALHRVGGDVPPSTWPRLIGLQLADGSFLPSPAAARPHRLGRFHPTLVAAIALATHVATT
ncbi:MAG: hypothetical protein KC464_11565, partial [Myxococcales bacterium]|nr:hypothetical protein [Myxococcales bacterium]